ncbi:MAG: DUF6382 domain-containing protein [Blautia sp.]|nr:FHA domain-containing protein [Blautia sp.]MDY3998023.1 DUF6382 domain-containing protein [Blautia sp.]
MRAEYKRDMNHNYLILQGDQEVDTSSYQVRMLAGNVLPSILKCRLQGLDGKILFYYEITSRQSIVSLYEEKKFGIEDLRLIFGGFLQTMEEMGEYLLNPGQLLLDPEYVYVDVEKRNLQFCYLPGYEREVREQFQAFAEYILPKLDHEDERAVMLGYSVYRSALEECFHLEHIKQVMYQEKEAEFPKVPAQELVFQHEEEKDTDLPENFVWSREESESGKYDDVKAESVTKTVKQKGPGGKFLIIAGTILAVLGLTGILAANLLGYLPWLSVEIAMGTGVVLLGIGVSGYLFSRRKKLKEEENWRRKVQQKRKQKIMEEDCKNQRQKHMEADENSYVGQPENEQTAGFTDRMSSADFGETVVLSANVMPGPSSLVSREPGELATIYLKDDITIIGKLETACDAVIPLPTVSRIHCKIRKREDGYYLTDLNSRNGTSINGIMLKGAEEYLLHNEDEVDFAQARYIFME